MGSVCRMDSTVRFCDSSAQSIRTNKIAHTGFCRGTFGSVAICSTFRRRCFPAISSADLWTRKSDFLRQKTLGLFIRTRSPKTFPFSIAVASTAVSQSFFGGDSSSSDADSVKPSPPAELNIKRVKEYGDDTLVFEFGGSDEGQETGQNDPPREGDHHDDQGTDDSGAVSSSDNLPLVPEDPSCSFEVESAFCSVPHPSRASRGGEDAFLIEGNWLAVADGISSWAEKGVNAGLYSRELLWNCAEFIRSFSEEEEREVKRQREKGGGREGGKASSASPRSSRQGGREKGFGKGIRERREQENGAASGVSEGESERNGENQKESPSVTSSFVEREGTKGGVGREREGASGSTGREAGGAGRETAVVSLQAGENWGKGERRGEDASDGGTGDGASLSLLQVAGSAPSKPFLRPKLLIDEAHSRTDLAGSCTVTVASVQGRTLRVAHIGDSGFLVVRSGQILFRSDAMLHAFNDPFQIGRNCGDDPSCAQEYEMVLQKGDVLLLGTDGLFDNVFDDVIIQTINSGLEEDKSLELIARKIANLAHKQSETTNNVTPFSEQAKRMGVQNHDGGKREDVTVILGRIK